MRLKSMRPVVVLALLLAHGACSVYNDSCPQVSPRVWGELSRDLDIGPSLLSRCEAPVGNFLADALLGYPYELRDTDTGAPISVRVAMINSGSVSDEIVCGELGQRRRFLPRGVVTDQDVFQLLPGGDQVVLVKIKGGLIKSIMERAVSGLESAEAYFLQVAAELGIRVEVDCTGEAQTLGADAKTIATPGARIARIHIGSSVIDPDVASSLEGIFYLATLSSLVETDAQGIPHLGYVGFQDPSVIVFRTHIPLTDVVRWWLEEYPRDAEYPVTERRLDLINCPEDSGCSSP